MYKDPPPSYSQAIAAEQNIPSAPPGDMEPQTSNPPNNPYLTQTQPQPIQQQISNKPTPSAAPLNPVNPPTTLVINTQVIDPNLCPACRSGTLDYDYTCLGVCCAIVFFPVGILCCLAMRNRRCPQCNAEF